jgi:hypothetical protein
MKPMSDVIVKVPVGGTPPGTGSGGTPVGGPVLRPE